MKTSKQEPGFVLNPHAPLTQFIKNFKGKVSREAREFFTEYQVPEEKRSRKSECDFCGVKHGEKVRFNGGIVFAKVSACGKDFACEWCRSVLID